MAVMTQLNKLSEWRLLDLQSQVAILDDLQRGLVQFLQEESAFSGIFSASMLRRLQNIAEARAGAEIKQKAQRVLYLAERGRLRCAEHIAGKLESDAERDEASRQLAEAVESTARRMPQASRKLADSSSGTWDFMRDISGVDKSGFGYRPGRRQGS